MGPTLLLIFSGAVVIDILITLFTRCIARGRVYPASFLSSVITLGNLALWGTILRQAETTGFIGACVFSFGAGIGTYLGMRVFK